MVSCDQRRHARLARLLFIEMTGSMSVLAVYNSSLVQEGVGDENSSGGPDAFLPPTHCIKLFYVTPLTSID